MITFTMKDIAKRRRSEERLTKLNECFLGFTAEPQENINRLTAICGELMGGACALFNKLEAGMLHTLAHWNAPADFKMIDHADGHICHDVIKQGGDQLFYVQNLAVSAYAETDPNVKLYALHSYIGMPVKCDGHYVASLCVVFQKEFVPDEQDRKFMGILAVAVGVEEGRRIAAEQLRKSHEELETRVLERTAELGRLNEQLLIDIAERKRLEDEVRKSHKLDSLGILAGGIAHDFNNLLTGILGNISLAKLKMSHEDKNYMRLESAEKAAERARDLTQQLLTFSRGGAPIKKTASIEQILMDSASFVLRGSNVRCEFNIPDSVWPVEADEGQMNQVINNLIINADQAMPEGGIINVTIENLPIGPKDILTVKEGRYVKISIEDHGIGIAEQHLQKIFDPYFTTKQKGSGLGLATVYSIIKNHGGYIMVESTVGTGTIFHIYLPASENEILATNQSVENPLSGAGKILIMDDDEILREVSGEILSHLGYRVVVCSEGSQTISLYKEAMKSGDPFAAVIMDLTIPGGMGGKETMNKLLELDSEVKGIVSSGYCNDPILANYRDYGFISVVAKPYNMEELGKVLHDTLLMK